MDRKVICLDTSILIDYFRKGNKAKTFFFELVKAVTHNLKLATLNKVHFERIENLDLVLKE
jgi:predicted nucleic acid-binding protein